MSETADVSDPLVVVVSRRIDAPAHELFEVLRSPKRHCEFDGSTMVRDSDALPIDGVGDTFVMRMHNEEFGDYEMRNIVVEYVQDVAIAWAPGFTTWTMTRTGTTVGAGDSLLLARRQR